MAFKKGQSGNPKGRPKGAKGKKQAYFESKEPELQKKLLEMALAGDLGAMKIIADRIWPKRRSEAMPISIKAKSSALSDMGGAVIAAALSGEIPTGTLRDVLVALSAQTSIIEATELEERITALENFKDAPPWVQRSEPKLPLRKKRRALH